MIIRLAIVIAMSVSLGACASTATERAFGDATRSVIAQQRQEPEPREVEPSTDGQRMESVMSLHRTWVGDPLPVVRQRPVESGQ